MVVCISQRDYAFFTGFKNYSFVLPPELFATLATRAEQAAHGDADESV